MTVSQTSAPNSIDPAMVAGIVRRVLQRIGYASLENGTARSAATATNATAVSLRDRVVTASLIEALVGNPDQIFIDANAVVTPAARDAANLRSIEITRSTEIPPAMQPRVGQAIADHRGETSIIDSENPDRAAAFGKQLAARGVVLGQKQLVLSDTPAIQLYDAIRSGARATMVSEFADVERFEAELQPQVWVLDMVRLNFTAAVNIAAKILRTH